MRSRSMRALRLDKNLHFDHDIPFSKGGSSLTTANVRLLCAKYDLQKSDKISQSRARVNNGDAVSIGERDLQACGVAGELLKPGIADGD
jgi:5-methylcytosine-specific restriction endonuclease McrA